MPLGKVIGVDIQPEMVAHLVQKAQRLEVTNVEANLGKVDSVQLPEESVDAVIMVDAYHEFSHPNEMMQSIFLRPQTWWLCLFVGISGRGSCRAD